MPSEENRFQPPTSDVTEPESPIITDYELAKRDQRATGFIIDALICYPLMLLTKILPGIIGIFTLLDIDTGSFSNFPAWMITLLFYYLLCEGIWHRTIGKLITGTRVVQTSGSNPAFNKIILRTFIRFIPLEFLTYLEKNKQPNGWHDRWSDTRVINTPAHSNIG